jgi:hypothetical protein
VLTRTNSKPDNESIKSKIFYNIYLLLICTQSHKKLHNGEKILDILENVEDSKGNPGERDPGRVIVTNLRIIWYSLTNPKFTLCECEILWSHLERSLNFNLILLYSYRIFLHNHYECQERNFEVARNHRWDENFNVYTKMPLT